MKERREKGVEKHRRWPLYRTFSLVSLLLLHTDLPPCPPDAANTRPSVRCFLTLSAADSTENQPIDGDDADGPSWAARLTGGARNGEYRVGGSSDVVNDDMRDVELELPTRGDKGREGADSRSMSESDETWWGAGGRGGKSGSDPAGLGALSM